MEIAAGLDVADDRHERGRIDQLVEAHVIQFELAANGNHHAVQPFLDQAPDRRPRPIGCQA